MYSLFPAFLHEFNHTIPLQVPPWFLSSHFPQLPVLFLQAMPTIRPRAHSVSAKAAWFYSGIQIEIQLIEKQQRRHTVWDYPPSYLQLCFALKNLNFHGLVKVVSPNEIYSEERGPAKWCSPLDASHSIHPEEI